MAQPLPETLVVEQETTHRIVAAINDLPAAERDAVLLVYLEGHISGNPCLASQNNAPLMVTLASTLPNNPSHPPAG